MGEPTVVGLIEELVPVPAEVVMFVRVFEEGLTTVNFTFY
jgi:hypothetical protein